MIKLRGLVRPEDVSNQNQVLSTAMTDLELEVTGKGHRERLDLPAESAGALAGEAGGVLIVGQTGIREQEFCREPGGGHGKSDEAAAGKTVPGGGWR